VNTGLIPGRLSIAKSTDADPKGVENIMMIGKPVPLETDCPMNGGGKKEPEFWYTSNPLGSVVVNVATIPPLVSVNDATLPNARSSKSNVIDSALAAKPESNIRSVTETSFIIGYLGYLAFPKAYSFYAANNIFRVWPTRWI